MLLVFSSAASFLALRQLLISDAGDRVDDALVQETREFRTLVTLGRNPQTGARFGGDLRAIFDVYLSRNVPAEGEEFFTFVDRLPYRTTRPEGPVAAELARIGVGAVGQSARGEFELGETRYRYLAVPVRRSDVTRGVFVVTIDLESELDEVGAALRIAAGVSIGVLLLASILAWVIAGRVLAPLRLLGSTARAISDTDLTRRIAVSGHDELGQLARTFNAMLDRLESAFASQKSFISDAGHELRTPITIIRGHLELLGDDPLERHETIELVTDELDRMSRFVDDLLLLAKAERPDFLRPQELDIDLLARELHAKASALAPRDWRLEHAGAGRIVADRQRLTQAIVNLAQNAVQQTGEGDRLSLGAQLRNGTARLWVTDSGAGIPASERERIFDRFSRGAGARHEGTGLGLAIVRAIAEGHGGHVELDSVPGKGSRFTVVIPAQPPVATAPPRDPAATEVMAPSAAS